MMNAQTRLYYFAMLPAVALLALLFVWPLVQVLWLSVSEPTFGLQNYAELADNPLLQRVWLNTIRVCGITTLVSVTGGYLVAFAMIQAGSRQRMFIVFCIVLTFWLSVLIRAFAWVMLLRAEGLVNSSLIWLGVVHEPLRLVRNEFGVLIGMIHYMLPVAILPIYSNMQSISGRYVDAARGLGAKSWQAFLWVYLPMTKPGIISSAILVFIFSIGFYITPAILGGGKVVMIAEYLRVSFEETLRWGYATMLASTLLIVLAVFLIVLAQLVDLRKIFGT
jgi:putative spermidine/putrescine transport system permease protein